MTAHIPVPASREVTEIKVRLGWFDLDFPGVWKSRELLWFLILRDLKVRYKQALLGVAWSVMQPLFAVIVFTVVFGVFARLPSDGMPYSLFALSAMMPWMLFSEAVRRSALGLVGDGALISKVYFPRLIVPLANVLTPVLDFFVMLVVFVIVMMFYGVYPTFNLLLLPVLVLITALLGLAIGLWLGPLNVRYRDITHTLPFMLQIWMYATPVVYPLSMIPDRWRVFYDLNPTVGLVEGFRWSLLGRGHLDIQAIAIGAMVTLVLVCSGVVFFRRSEPRFADIL